jgi:AcrR family transcriptional regulator
LSTSSPKQAPRRTYDSPRQQARRERILEVARQEIGRLGCDAVSVEHLASHAEVSIKTLYNIFGSKDELVLHAVQSLYLEVHDHARQIGAREGVESLIAACEASADLVRTNPNYVDAMARAFFRLGEESNLFLLLAGAPREEIEADLRLSLQAGELQPDVDIDELIELFNAHQWGLVLAWSKGLISNSAFPKQALRSQLATLFPVSRGRLKTWLRRKAATHDIPL